MKITTSNLIRWAGFSAMGAGIMYVIVGLLHPFVSHHGGLSSVTTDVWLLTHSLTIGVSFFGLLGIAGTTPGKWKGPVGLVWPTFSYSAYGWCSCRALHSSRP